MNGIKLQRLGLIMEPEPGNRLEEIGTLNPAAARGPDGPLYLFPRLVARGNDSRIGIAKVRFDGSGAPVGIERLGFALEPEADYELRRDGGGCEDPRVTFVEPLRCYVMTYTAYSRTGPRIALAASEDLIHWRRLGLATFTSWRGIDFSEVDNKDASLFPVAIPNPTGTPEVAILHRPLFPGTRPEETVRHPPSREMDIHRESIWISYCTIAPEKMNACNLGHFSSHHRLASPVWPWERLKIGGGTPPVPTRHGWLVVFHGVREIPAAGTNGPHLRYSAGVMILSNKHPRHVIYRSMEPPSPRRLRTNARERSPTSCFQQESTAGMTSACRTASMFTTAWRTAGSAWRGWTCRNACRKPNPPCAATARRNPSRENSSARCQWAAPEGKIMLRSSVRKKFTIRIASEE